MAVTAVTGRRQYDTRSNRIIPNVYPVIMLLDANLEDAMFLTFFMRLNSEVSPTEKFEWDADEFLALNDTTSAAVSSTTTNVIPVTTPSLYIPNTLWMNGRTGEIILVQSVNTGSATITVVRAVSALNSSGGTAAANMNSGDTLIRLGPAVGEVNLRQTTQTTLPNNLLNYTQAMRWDVQMSRRQKKRTFLDDQDWTYEERKTLLEARKQINGTLIAGQKARYTDSVMGDVTLTEGLRHLITTNVLAAGGTLYEATWDYFLLSQGLRFGARNKVLLSSNYMIAAMTQMTKDRTTFFVDLGGGGETRTNIGIQVLEYMGPQGKTLQIVEDRFISENLNGEAYGVDLNQFRRKVFSGNGIDDDLHIEENTQDPDDLGSAFTLYADMGLQWGLEKHHFKVTGITGGAKGFSVT